MSFVLHVDDILFIEHDLRVFLMILMCDFAFSSSKNWISSQF